MFRHYFVLIKASKPVDVSNLELVLMKNYFDSLWYGRLGLGMTRRAVNVQHVVYSNRHKVNELEFWRWSMDGASTDSDHRLTAYILSGRNGK